MGVQQSHTGTVDGAVNFGGTTWEAQTFTPAVSHKCTQVDLVLYDNAGADADMTCMIWAVDSSSPDPKPDNGDILGTATLVNTSTIQDIGDFPAEVYVSFTFSTSVSLTAGTMYAIVIKAPDEASAAALGNDAASGYTRGVGWQSTNGGVAWSGASVDFLFKEYSTTPSDFVPTSLDLAHSRQLVAVAGNQVWVESSAGTMAVVSGATVDVTKILDIAELYGKAFIANDTIKKVLDLTNVSITTDGMDAQVVKGMILTGGNSSAEMVVDYVTALSGTATIYGKRITTATFTTGETVTGTLVSFVMTAPAEVAAPHFYDWTAFGGDEDTYGTMPTNCTIVANYRGRAVLSGDSKAPHQWYMSRQGNTWNWAYGQNDAQSAVAGNNADAGEIGDIVTGLIPYKDDWLVIGCAGSMWYLTGDPAEGGSLDELDLTVGLYSKDSWCFDGGGNLYFWGTNGLYRVKVPSQPECISEIKLPKLIEDEAANPSTHKITLSYDRRRAGINVTITKNSDGTNSNYWYDLRTGGFFPESFPEECGVYSAVHYEATNPDYKKVMFGCRDGYIRYFLDSAADDDAGALGDEAINAYVTYAPLPMSSKNKFEGKLTDFDVVPAGGGSGGTQSDSNNISYEIYTEIDAEKVLESLAAGTNPKAAGTVTAPGRGRGSLRKKIRGVYMGIKLFNSTATQVMALEDLMYEVRQSGRLK